jgi:hypothetical protein
MDNKISIPRPEIVAPPSVSNLTVAQAGPGMFSVTMQVVMVVRFPTEETSTDTPTAAQIVASSPVPALTPVAAAVAMMYGNGEKPEADGEPEAFQAFVQTMGYPPQTREVLIQWATVQGGA